MRQQKAMRGLLAVVAAGTTLLAVADARADEREQCASAADQAQQLRDEGKYRRAREQLLVCARDVCPGPIKRDCHEWLSQLEANVPTVVFAARDGNRDLVDVKVYVDGALVAERLEGRPVQMDLGPHTVRFEYQGQSKEETVVIGAGQKSRNIAVTFGASPPAGGGAPPPPARAGEGGGSSIVPALVVGGIGIAALGSFAIFGLSGKGDVDDLQACKPRCNESDVDSARTKLIVADISLGIGVVALGVATYMFLTRPKVDAEVKAARIVSPPRAPRTVSVVEGWRVDFGPAAGGGAVGSVGARF